MAEAAMAVLFWPLERFNTAIVALGRALAMAVLAIMVWLISGQVFFRYVLNDAPNWTEEGARFGGRTQCRRWSLR